MYLENGAKGLLHQSPKFQITKLRNITHLKAGLSYVASRANVPVKADFGSFDFRRGFFK